MTMHGHYVTQVEWVELVRRIGCCKFVVVLRMWS